MTSATDNRTTELLCCPFCGGEAELKHYQSGDWQVICYHADGCIMRESDLDNCYWENVQMLARQWNTRAELGSGTCEPLIEPWESDTTKFDAYCGNCGWEIQDQFFRLPNYCPNCGRKVKR